MDRRNNNMVDDASVSDIYTTDGANKDEFRMDQEETMRQMKHLLDSTLLVRRDEDEDPGNMSDINDDGNESILSDNALFRAEVEAEERRIMAEYDLGRDFERAVSSKQEPAPGTVLMPSRPWIRRKVSKEEVPTKRNMAPLDDGHDDVDEDDDKLSPNSLSPRSEATESNADSSEDLETPEPSLQVPWFDEAAGVVTPAKRALNKKLPSGTEYSVDDDSLPSHSLDSGLARRLQVLSDSEEPSQLTLAAAKAVSPDRTQKTFTDYSPDQVYTRDPENPPFFHEGNRPPSMIICGGPYEKQEHAPKPETDDEESRKRCWKKMTEDKLGRLVLVLLFILVIAVAVAIFSLVKYGDEGQLFSRSSRESTGPNSPMNVNITTYPIFSDSDESPPQPLASTTDKPSAAPALRAGAPSSGPAANVQTTSPTACVDDPSAKFYVNSDYGEQSCSWLPDYAGHRKRLCASRALDVCCATCAMDSEDLADAPEPALVSSPVSGPTQAIDTPTIEAPTEAPTKRPVQSSRTLAPTRKSRSTPKPTSKPTPAPVKGKDETIEPTMPQYSITDSPTWAFMMTTEPTNELVPETTSPTVGIVATVNPTVGTVSTEPPEDAVDGAAETQSQVEMTILASANAVTLAALADSSSSQAKALRWVQNNIASDDEQGIKQAFALANLAFATGYKNWSKSRGWLDGATSICDWNGVSCNNGAVTDLSLRGNGLKGKLPVELSYLGDTLVSLDLGENTIKGAIPYSLGLQFPNLQNLMLDNNSMKGKLPKTIGSLTTLRTLHVQYNSFSGQVPSTFSSLSKLTELSLWHNDLTGTLPKGVCQIKNLQDINLDCREVESNCWTTCFYQCSDGKECDPDLQ